MIGSEDLPHLNATLNATSAVLLVAGRAAIRRGDRLLHRRLMIAAFSVSVAFLASYLTYHALHGSRPFPGHGWLRTAYLAVLLSHIVLAAAVPPLAIVSLARGLRGEDARHRRIVRWAWPVWMYVSVTGVVVYVMLYHVGASS